MKSKNVENEKNEKIKNIIKWKKSKKTEKNQEKRKNLNRGCQQKSLPIPSVGVSVLLPQNK